MVKNEWILQRKKNMQTKPRTLKRSDKPDDS